MNVFKFILKDEIDRLLTAVEDKTLRLQLFSNMCRLNALSEIKRAGSGHLGSTLSAIDIVSTLYLELMNVRERGLESEDRDIFFSSKGHDVPRHYAVLYGLGFLDLDALLKLRRFGGLDGHPDCRFVMEACTGSLGMGLSKAKGMSRGKRMNDREEHVIVMTGDGELQEGQIWESARSLRIQATTWLWLWITTRFRSSGGGCRERRFHS